jgi:hypothetical protein
MVTCRGVIAVIMLLVGSYPRAVRPDSLSEKIESLL